MIFKDKVTEILFVDDDEDDFLILKDFLNDIEGFQFTIEWIPSFREAEISLLKHKYDLIFFDYLIGVQTGVDLLKRVTHLGITTPIIFLTGKYDHKIDLEAMEAGASDYLIKSAIDSEKLERSIRYTLNRQKSIEELKISEARYRNIFERSRDMIYVTDYYGNFVTVNESASRIFGYSHAELITMNAKDLYVKSENLDSYLAILNNYGVVSNYEVELRDKEGNIKQCIISGSIQKMDGYDKVHYQGVVHDITRRKKAERDLIIAEKLAITGLIVRTLAHEVRNPLTNINLSVEQIEYETDNPELKIYFEIIKRNSIRINDLISELLQSSKPTEINKSTTSLNSLVKETLDLAMDRIILKNIQVECVFEEQICNIPLDKNVMKIALLNIIVNAIEAMSEEGGILKITTSSEAEKCFVKIIDNGSGISEENLGHLFEPYFTGKQDGVGLGLATTHNIIHSHNGTIEVKSELGKGTNFIISLNKEG